MGVEGFGKLVLFGVPEDVDEFIGEDHVKLVADLYVGEKGGVVNGFESFICDFVIYLFFVDLNDRTVPLNLAQKYKVVAFY